jgi:predicted RNA-binding Zn-ribbon protein involved in translation (DUF1610 family)
MRRPAVNPRPVGSGNSDNIAEVANGEICHRCGVRLSYIEEIEVLLCPECGRVKKVQKQEEANKKQ